MIDVYKIGLKLYNDVDKNSGLFEYKLIKSKIEEALNCGYISINKSVLIIINGSIDNEEEEYLLSKLKTYDKAIFIASDIISLKSNRNIIDKCDVLLHQCPKRNIDGINIKQHYSYVPELFYTYKTFCNYDDRENALFFGGGVRDMEEVLTKIQNLVKCNFILKNSTSDNRLPYDEYIKEQLKHKYTLITCRKDYSEIGWVTARFIECIANNNFPIVLSCYDTDDYFGIFKIKDLEDIPVVINYLETSNEMRTFIINNYKRTFSLNNYKFLTLLEELCNE